MIWGYSCPRADVADLVPGQVVTLGYDPSEPGCLHWLGPVVSAHLMLVEVTVESNEIQPDTATETTRTVTEAGTHVWTAGHRELRTLRFLYEGQGYQTEVRGGTLADPLPAHHPRCAKCGELWPCRDERLDSEALLFTSELDDRCAHCGQPIGGSWSESFFDGVTTRRYHLAKNYRAGGKACRAALAEARASLPGLDDHRSTAGGDGIGDGCRED